jgi:hypothetical protein
MLWSTRVFFNGSYTTITNIQEVSVSGGRQALVDNFSSTRCTITCRYPNGYTTPVSNLVSGQPISVQMRNEPGLTTAFTVFDGFVSDVEVQYGMPYQSGVGQADYLVITCETALARLARTVGNGYAMPADTILEQITRASNETLVGINYSSPDFTKQIGGTTVDGSWADWLNQLALTVAGRIADTASIILTGQGPYEDVSTYGVSFSDSATLGASDIPYNSIQFDSLAQNYFTQVTVDPVSFAAQTVSSIPVGESPRNYTVDTYNGSDAQTTDTANFYLSQFSTPKIGISQIGFTFNVLDTSALQTAVSRFFASFNPIAYQVPLLFRGTTYQAMIEGFQLSLTPESQSCSFYVSDNSLNNFLVLNNSNFGRLDFNKLGF